MLVIAGALAAGSSAAGSSAAEPFRFERVDLLSVDPGTFQLYDVPATGAYPLRTVIRFAEQVKVVWDLPGPLTLGTSITSQSLGYQRPVGPFSVGGGLQTLLLCPRGVYADAAWQTGRLRLGLGVSVLSSATWGSLDWRVWHAFPAVELGIGRAARPREATP